MKVLQTLLEDGSGVARIRRFLLVISLILRIDEVLRLWLLLLLLALDELERSSIGLVDSV